MHSILPVGAQLDRHDSLRQNLLSKRQDYEVGDVGIAKFISDTEQIV